MDEGSVPVPWLFSSDLNFLTGDCLWSCGSVLHTRITWSNDIVLVGLGPMSPTAKGHIGLWWRSVIICVLLRCDGRVVHIPRMFKLVRVRLCSGYSDVPNSSWFQSWGGHWPSIHRLYTDRVTKATLQEAEVQEIMEIGRSNIRPKDEPDQIGKVSWYDLPLSFLIFVCPPPHLCHLPTPSDLVRLPSAASAPTLRCTHATMLHLHLD